MSEDETTPKTAARKAAARRLAPRPRRAHGAVRRLRDADPVRQEHGGIVAEHDWTRSHAGPVRCQPHGPADGHRRGRGRARSKRCCPADVTSLKPGQMRYSLLLAEDGGILDDLMVTNTSRDGTSSSISSSTARPSGTTSPTCASICPTRSGLNHLEDRALLALQGPEAAARSSGVMPGCTDDLGFMQATGWQFGELDLIGIGRSGYTGEDGFEISVRRRAGRTARRRADGRRARSSPSASARAIRCGSKPACRSTATT